MEFIFVFNELSQTLRGLNDGFTGLFLQIPRTTTQHQPRLVVPPKFLSLQVAPGTSIGRWLDQFPIGDDRARRLRRLLEQSALYEDYVSDDCEHKVGSQVAVGLGIAEASDGVAFSLTHTDDTILDWHIPLIPVERSSIEDNDVSVTSCDVRNVGRVEHWATHTPWLESLKSEPPRSGGVLWEQREELFPHLDFCPKVEEQVSEFRDYGTPLREIVRALTDLEAYCASWTGDGFDIHRLGAASPESKTRLDKYPELFSFNCPDGIKRIFSHHVKRGAMRAHFRENAESKRILIGYVGRKLAI